MSDGGDHPGGQELSVEVRHDGVSTVVELSGELTATSGDLVVGIVQGELSVGLEHLVLDLTGVQQCDRSGAAAVHVLRREAAAAGAVLVLRGSPGSGPVRQPVMWLDDLLTRPGRGRREPRC